MVLHNATPSSRLLALSKAGTLFHEPSPRQYKAYVKANADPSTDKPVLIGKDVHLVWEDGAWLPYLAFPRSSIPFAGEGAFKFVSSSETREKYTGPALRQGNLATEFYDLVDGKNGSVIAKHVAWTWTSPSNKFPFDISFPTRTTMGSSSIGSGDNGATAEIGLEDLVGVSDAAFGTWFEEGERLALTRPAIIKDPYHRVDTVRCDRHVQVYAADGEDGKEVLLADSKKSVIVFETGLTNRYYLPREDVFDAAKTLSKDVTSLKTACPYKGEASYHDVILPSGTTLENQVWTYLDPLEEVGKLKGLIAFYAPGPKFKLVVDGEEVVA